MQLLLQSLGNLQDIQIYILGKWYCRIVTAEYRRLAAGADISVSTDVNALDVSTQIGV